MTIEQDEPMTEQAPPSNAENINALSEISKKLPILLQTAGAAIQTLTPSGEFPTEDQDGKAMTALQARKANFINQSQVFYQTLRSVRTTLLTQATALIDAGLHSNGDGEENDRDSGYGELDVGYLNARARDMGLVKRSELVKEARNILAGMVEGKSKTESEDEDMAD